MQRQDVDPLADTVPPRHAYESDEEDEYTAFPGQDSSGGHVQVIPQDVTVIVDMSQNCPTEVASLIVVSGDAGKTWAKGADLGQQTGRIIIETVQVGLIFQPSWTDAIVLVSEVTTRLPAWAMHPFAETVLNNWNPARVSILGSYATPAYTSSQPVAHHDSPIRYLNINPSGVQKVGTTLNAVAPFSPPNLLQGTAASFLSILALPEWSKEKRSTTAIFLLPSPYIATPPPTSLASTDITLLSTGTMDGVWDNSMIQAAHQLLLAAAEISGGKQWVDGRVANKNSEEKIRSRKGDVGEGGMYI